VNPEQTQAIRSALINRTDSIAHKISSDSNVIAIISHVLRVAAKNGDREIIAAIAYGYAPVTTADALVNLMEGVII